MDQTPQYILDKIQEAKEKGLTYLNLRNNQLTSLPESIGQLVNLTELVLYNNQLTSLPELIGQLVNLTRLDLCNNQLTSLPDSIGQLVNLTRLYLSSNRLTSLPESIGQLVNLTELYLDSNELASLPESIGQLVNLTELYLSSNQLTSLPESIGQLVNLTRLDLGGNQLASLPESIGQLVNLTRLYLSSNRLTSLPESIGQLVNLTRLGLSANALTGLPESIGQLVNLTELNLDSNPLEAPPPEVVKKGIEAIRDYFRQRQEEGEDTLYEAKLLILGEGGAGKTTLAKKIDNSSYLVPNNENTTHGIDVREWTFLMEDGQNFRVNIWDFGGQEIYHTTHQFFLTKRSLYVLLADNRKEDTDFYYWLNVVELLSDNSPLLIIKNEKENRKRDINEPKLRERFENLKETLATNFADNRGLDTVIKNLKHYITGLPHIGSKLPKTWIRVREVLEKDLRNYISLEEYLSICEKNGFKRIEDKLQLSQFLHDIGVILHFQDNQASPLYKTIILKPEWGTDAVYKVLDNPIVIENQGKFTTTALNQIWSEKKYADMQPELLELMMKFKLCYKLPHQENTYIAPQLLTPRQPDYDWNRNNNLILRYTYDFMPKGILTQFIVATHRDIDESKYVWKTGVILKRGNTKAEITEDHPKKEIKIRIVGNNQRDLLTIVTNELDKIHYSYHRLNYSKLIPCNCSVCKNNQDPHFYDFEKLIERRNNNKKTVECNKPPYHDVNVLQLIDNARGENKMERKKIFISYSHQDEKWLKSLQVYLKPLERKGLINYWDDTKIKPGMKWREEIQKALNSAKVAILLVSSNFFNSNFIDDVELPASLKAAEDEGAVILPVILDPCTAIFGGSELEQFQAFNSPSQPLCNMTENDYKQVLNRVAARVIEIFHEKM